MSQADAIRVLELAGDGDRRTTNVTERWFELLFRLTSTGTAIEAAWALERLARLHRLLHEQLDARAQVFAAHSVRRSAMLESLLGTVHSALTIVSDENLDAIERMIGQQLFPLIDQIAVQLSQCPHTFVVEVCRSMAELIGVLLERLQPLDCAFDIVSAFASNAIELTRAIVATTSTATTSTSLEQQLPPAQSKPQPSRNNSNKHAPAPSPEATATTSTAVDELVHDEEHDDTTAATASPANYTSQILRSMIAFARAHLVSCAELQHSTHLPAAESPVRREILQLLCLQHSHHDILAVLLPQHVVQLLDIAALMAHGGIEDGLLQHIFRSLVPASLKAPLSWKTLPLATTQSLVDGAFQVAKSLLVFAGANRFVLFSSLIPELLWSNGLCSLEPDNQEALAAFSLRIAATATDHVQRGLQFTALANHILPLAFDLATALADKPAADVAVAGLLGGPVAIARVAFERASSRRLEAFGSHSAVLQLRTAWRFLYLHFTPEPQPTFLLSSLAVATSNATVTAAADPQPCVSARELALRIFQLLQRGSRDEIRMLGNVAMPPLLNPAFESIRRHLLSPTALPTSTTFLHLLTIASRAMALSQRLDVQDIDGGDDLPSELITSRTEREARVADAASLVVSAVLARVASDIDCAQATAVVGDQSPTAGAPPPVELDLSHSTEMLELLDLYKAFYADDLLHATSHWHQLSLPDRIEQLPSFQQVISSRVPEGSRESP